MLLLRGGRVMSLARATAASRGAAAASAAAAAAARALLLPPPRGAPARGRCTATSASATANANTPTPSAKFCRHCGASPMQVRVPEGDTHPRDVCPACGGVEYRNPRLVVGCIVSREAHGGAAAAAAAAGAGAGGGGGTRSPAPWGAEVLLCRRAIEPQRGRWTLPAGYLEVGESCADGARREALEETGADVSVLRPYAHFDVPAIGQAYLIFLARLSEGGRAPAAATEESLETRWFSVLGEAGSGGGGGGGGGAREGVPWSELAFSSVSTALRLYAEDVEAAAKRPEAAGEGAAAAPLRFFRQHHGVIERQAGAGPNEAGTYFLRDHTWTGGV